MGNIINFCIDKIIPLISKKEEKKEEKTVGIITNVDNSNFAPSNSIETQNFPYTQKNSIESISQCTIKCNQIKFRKKRNLGHLTPMNSSNFAICNAESKFLNDEQS